MPGTSKAEVGWPWDGAIGRGNCGPSIGGGELTGRRWLRLERRGFSFGCERTVSGLVSEAGVCGLAIWLECRTVGGPSLLPSLSSS